jgi:hypothetical protein
MDQKYTDQQMALILKRAAEMQAAGDESSHSLESIQEIARQVGIDPRLVAEAATSLDAPRANRSLFGAPSAFRVARRLSGSAVPIDHAAVLGTIRDHLPFAGEARNVGDGIEWHSGPADNKTVVAISPTANGPMLRIDARQHGTKAMLYLAAGTVGVTVGAASVALLSVPAVAVAVGVGTFAASFAGARAIWNRHAKRQSKRFRALSDALAGQLGGSEGSRPD